MYDCPKLLEISDDLLNSIKVLEEALNSLIMSTNKAGDKLNKHFGSPENKALHEIMELINSTVIIAENEKRYFLKTRNTIEKLRVYLKFPSLNYYWV